MTCPHCDGCAACHDGPERGLVSLFGPLRCRRAYCSCRRCGRGLCPFDGRAGIAARDLTPAAEQLTGLAGGVCDSFAKGAELLDETAAVRLSESTAERTAEDVGRRLAGHLHAGEPFGPPVTWAWHEGAKGRSVACVTIDATGTRQQGPGGRAAEGRMACVAAVYNPAPPDRLLPPGKAPPPPQARYLSGLYALPEMGPLLRRQAAQVGMGGAEVWGALTDGGSGLEGFVQSDPNRAGLVVIPDFYHPASCREQLARALRPTDEEQARARAAQWRRLLKDEGGAATPAVLRAWAWPARQPEALRAQRQRAEEDFGHNVHRMEYPEYQAGGWQIGSGVAESACKAVVGQRLKGAGKRWGEDGAHALCHVRPRPQREGPVASLLDTRALQESRCSAS